ncbi:MAG: 16S rRNA processing protein RimM [Ruminococcus sp.]|nr:16S rRNA processing protein RimM [Ruminococcus sp.]
MKKEYLEIGKIVNVHGLRGDVKVMPWCDDPELLCEFDSLYIDRDKKEIFIEDARVFKNTVIMRFEGCGTVEAAEKLRNKILYIHRDDLELEEGVYFIQDLIGLEVIDADTGKVYGTLKDVSQTGANDVYEVRDEEQKKSYWIPAIPQVVVETDIDGGVMKIRPLEGLLDAN